MTSKRTRELAATALAQREEARRAKAEHTRQLAKRRREREKHDERIAELRALEERGWLVPLTDMPDLPSGSA